MWYTVCSMLGRCSFARNGEGEESPNIKFANTKVVSKIG